jgi:hypothetical protein
MATSIYTVMPLEFPPPARTLPYRGSTVGKNLMTELAIGSALAIDLLLVVIEALVPALQIVLPVEVPRLCRLRCCS